MTSACRLKHSKGGFTLIELLIVIAVIAILAAILFPVFAKARENARRSACLSNLKQLGMAAMQYTQDFDEKLPVVGGSTSGGWAGLIYPYARSQAVFKCPNDRTAGFNISFGGNMNVMQADPTRTPHLPSFNNVAKTILLFEAEDQAVDLASTMNESTSCLANGTDRVPGGTYCSYATGYLGGRGNYNISGASYNAWSNASTTVGRHLEGSNFGFLDGHVKWLKGNNVSSGYNGAGTSAQNGNNAAGTGVNTYAATFSTR